jgi:flagellar basal body-associated protein FliL
VWSGARMVVVMAIVITLLSVALLISFILRGKKHTPPKRTAQQTQDDELITVILPTITNDE